MAIIPKTPTISTSAYATGDVIGGKVEISGFNANTLMTLSVYDDDGEGVQLDFFFFNGTLSGTYTDNAAFSIAAADKDKWFGVVSIATSDYIAAGSDKVASKRSANLKIPSDIVTVITVIRSTTTFTTTSDLLYKFHILE